MSESSERREEPPDPPRGKADREDMNTKGLAAYHFDPFRQAPNTPSLSAGTSPQPEQTGSMAVTAGSRPPTAASTKPDTPEQAISSEGEEAADETAKDKNLAIETPDKEKQTAVPNTEHFLTGTISRALSRANTPLEVALSQFAQRKAQRTSILGPTLAPQPTITPASGLAAARLLTVLNPSVVAGAVSIQIPDATLASTGLGNSTSNDRLRAGAAGLDLLAEAAAFVSNLSVTKAPEQGSDVAQNLTNSNIRDTRQAATLLASLARPSTPAQRSLSPRRPTPSPITPAFSPPRRMHPESVHDESRLSQNPEGALARRLQKSELSNTAADSVQANSRPGDTALVAAPEHDLYVVKKSGVIMCDICRVRINEKRDAELYQCQTCRGQICSECVEDKLAQERAAAGVKREEDADGAARTADDDIDVDASGKNKNKSSRIGMDTDYRFEWRGRRQHLPFILCYLDRKAKTGYNLGPWEYEVTIPDSRDRLVHVEVKFVANDRQYWSKLELGPSKHGKMNDEVQREMLKTATKNTTTKAFQAFKSQKKVQTISKEQATKTRGKKKESKGTQEEPIDVDAIDPARQALMQTRVQDAVFGKSGRGDKLKRIQEAAKKPPTILPKPPPIAPRLFQNVGRTGYVLPNQQLVRDQEVLPSQRLHPEPNYNEDSFVARPESVNTQYVQQPTHARGQQHVAGHYAHGHPEQVHQEHLGSQQSPTLAQIQPPTSPPHGVSSHGPYVLAQARSTTDHAQWQGHNSSTQHGHPASSTHHIEYDANGQAGVVYAPAAGYEPSASAHHQANVQPYGHNYQAGVQLPGYGQQAGNTQPPPQTYDPQAEILYGTHGQFGSQQQPAFSVAPPGAVDHFAQIDQQETMQERGNAQGPAHGGPSLQDTLIDPYAQLQAQGHVIQQQQEAAHRRAEQQQLRQFVQSRPQPPYIPYIGRPNLDNRSGHFGTQQYHQRNTTAQTTPAQGGTRNYPTPQTQENVATQLGTHAFPPPAGPIWHPYIPLPSIEGANPASHPGVYLNESRDILPGCSSAFIEQAPTAEGLPMSIERPERYLNWIMATEQNQAAHIAAQEVRTAQMLANVRTISAPRQTRNTGPVETIVIDSDSDEQGEKSASARSMTPPRLRSHDSRSRSPARNKSSSVRDRDPVRQRAPDAINTLDSSQRPSPPASQLRPTTSRFADARLHTHPYPHARLPAAGFRPPQHGTPTQIGGFTFPFNFPLSPNIPQYAPESFVPPEYLTGLAPDRPTGSYAGLPIRYAYTVGPITPVVFGSGVDRVQWRFNAAQARRRRFADPNRGGVLRRDARQTEAVASAPRSLFPSIPRSARVVEQFHQPVVEQTDSDRLDVLAEAAAEAQDEMSSNGTGDTEMLSDTHRENHRGGAHGESVGSEDVMEDEDMYGSPQPLPVDGVVDDEGPVLSDEEIDGGKDEAADGESDVEVTDDDDNEGGEVEADADADMAETSDEEGEVEVVDHGDNEGSEIEVTVDDDDEEHDDDEEDEEEETEESSDSSTPTPTVAERGLGLVPGRLRSGKEFQ